MRFIIVDRIGINMNEEHIDHAGIYDVYDFTLHGGPEA